MSRIIASGVRSTMTKIAVAEALIAVIATGVTVPANAMPGFASRSGTPALLDDPNPGVPTGPDDPRCAATPGAAECQGGPFALPTGPLDPQCASMPADAACAGGPYAIPAPPPPAAPPIEAPEPPREPLAGMPEAPVGGGMPGRR
jgi:hypothetical protein